MTAPSIEQSAINMGADSGAGIDFLFANDFNGRIRAKAGIVRFRHSGTRASAIRNPYSRWWLWIPGSPGMTVGYQCSSPTIAPISSVVSVPETIDFNPSASTSLRRSGAITLKPPIMMPRLPKLAKPHIA